MQLTRKVYYAFIFSMTLHFSVSAGTGLNSYVVTSLPYLSLHIDTPRIVSFNSIINKKKVSLNWIVTENQQFSQFEVERSTNGKEFVLAALVFSTDSEGMENYYFIEKLKTAKTYYRVKTIAKDGSVNYSKIIIAGTI